MDQKGAGPDAPSESRLSSFPEQWQGPRQSAIIKRWTARK